MHPRYTWPQPGDLWLQVGTQMVLQDLGGCIFFTDPLTAHPHAEDIATLLRMCSHASLNPKPRTLTQAPNPSPGATSTTCCTPPTPPRPRLSCRCYAPSQRKAARRSKRSESTSWKPTLPASRRRLHDSWRIWLWASLGM